MRIYVPADAGLGAPEIAALKRLSRPSLQIIAEELTEPGSHETIRWILQQRDPEAALAQTISENVRHAVSFFVQNPNAGMGDLLGKSFFKKLVKVVKKVTVTIPKKIASAVAKHDPLYKVVKPTLTKVMKAVRKNLPIIMTVAGAVLAPFTGGASLAAAAVLTTARQLYAARIDTAKAVKAGKAEAGQMQAQVDQQTAQVTQQADDVYTQNQSIFLAAGYDQATWNGLTLDQKIDLIQQASNGTLKPTAAAIAAQQAAQQQIAQTATQTATSTAAAQMPQTQGPTTGTTAPSYTDTSSAPSAAVQPPPDTSGGVLPAPPDVAPAPPPPPAPDAPSFTQQTDETTGLPSASGYTLNVEGKTITNYPVDMGTLTPIITSGTQPGDRFEILADGQPTGLRVRTATGFISIPDSMRGQVMAMPHDQVLALLLSAQNRAAAANPAIATDEVTPQPASGGSGMVWLLLGGGVAALAASGGGKRR